MFNCQVMSDSLRLHRLQHVRLPCPSLSPGVCSNPCPLSWNPPEGFLYSENWKIQGSSTFSESISKPVLVMCVFTKSSLTLCDPMDCSLPGSLVHGILQARILEWVAISSSRGSSRPRDQTGVFCLAGGFFTTEPPGRPMRRDLLILILKIDVLYPRG